jgi:hypothetical protein
MTMCSCGCDMVLLTAECEKLSAEERSGSETATGGAAVERQPAQLAKTFCIRTAARRVRDAIGAMLAPRTLGSPKFGGTSGGRSTRA